MVAVGRVLLWTVALVAPGGFLLVPVLAATSLDRSRPLSVTLRERFAFLASRARAAVAQLQRYWMKS
jgi:hypothetical protein